MFTEEARKIASALFGLAAFVLWVIAIGFLWNGDALSSIAATLMGYSFSRVELHDQKGGQQ